MAEESQESERSRRSVLKTAGATAAGGGAIVASSGSATAHQWNYGYCPYKAKIECGTSSDGIHYDWCQSCSDECCDSGKEGGWFEDELWVYVCEKHKCCWESNNGNYYCVDQYYVWRPDRDATGWVAESMLTNWRWA